MLEKLAEIIRGEVREAGLSVEVPCIACDKRPYGSDACSADNFCPNVATPEGSLSLARWAVMLVAKGLEKLPEAKIEDLKERKRIEGMPTAEYMCAMSNLGINFLNLLSEAIISDMEPKEDTNE